MHLYIIGLIFFAALMLFFSLDNIKGAKPNILIVLTDDMGYGDVGFNGNQMIQTPTLDSLAKNGVVIDRFYVSPMGSQSLASLLTGKYQIDSDGLLTEQQNQEESSKEQNIAEWLKNYGYRTAYFGKWQNRFNKNKNPRELGFDNFFGFKGRTGSHFDLKLEYNGIPAQSRGYISDVLTDSTLAFIERNRKQPFLTFIAFSTPHEPYQVPDKYYQKYKALALDHHTATIYGMCENIDFNVSRILRQLEQLNILENTIIVFLSDNGPAYLRYNAGLKGRKAEVDEGGVRSPFILSYPNGKLANQVIYATSAAHIDLAPTLLHLLKIPFPATHFDGISLVPWLKDTKKEFPNRYLYEYIENNTAGNNWGAVRSDSFLLIINNQNKHFYNIITDKYQRKNTINCYQEEANRLSENYNQWLSKAHINSTNSDTVNHSYRVKLAVGEAFWEKRMMLGEELNYQAANSNLSDDSIYWELTIQNDGNYEVLVVYNWPTNPTVSNYELSMGKDTLSFTLQGEDFSEYSNSADEEITRNPESINQKVFKAGQLNLKKGINDLVLKMERDTASTIEIIAVELNLISVN
jgi:arylsulfatase A